MMRIKEQPSNNDLSEPSAVADITLIKALLDREEATIALLVDEWRPTMMHVALRYVTTPDVAEDVVQETWLAMLQGLAGFRGCSSLKTWTLSILIKRAQTRAKRDSRVITFSDLDEQVCEGETNTTLVQDRSDARLGGGRLLYSPPYCSCTPEDELLSSERLAYIHQAIADLPFSQRVVITLCDLEGWRAAEVCAMLGLSEANQRVLLSRARAKVRQMLQRYSIDRMR